MAEVSPPLRPGWWDRLTERLHAWQAEKIASPRFQRWAARSWMARPFMRRDAARVYDLVAGFVYSQTLLACTELGVLEALASGPARAEALAVRTGLAPDRMCRLCQAAAAVGLLARRRDGSYRLARLGAAVLGVPGLDRMIRHHAVFYRDLTDPVALLKGQTDPELSRFWSYVRDADGVDPATAQTYSDLMATSQRLVAEETLEAVSLDGVRHLVDVGGGAGAFLEQVAARYPAICATLFDLPAVAAVARDRLSAAGLAARVAVEPGSFLSDSLPGGGDAISLIRVLYDHDDATVRALLARVRAALPAGGRLIVSEPMSGGAQPERAGDAYFGFYTLAMTTGRPRSPDEISTLLREAGFGRLRMYRTARPFLTSVVSAVRRD